MNDSKGFLTNGVKLTLKLFFIGFIGILMLIATYMINLVVSEREQYKNKATEIISNSWGGKQIITPPVLTIPVKATYKNAKDKSTSTSISYIHFLPDELRISSSLKPETRYKGIFKKIVYVSDIKIDGTFPVPVINKVGADEINILWNEAFIATGITDTKGIQAKPTIEVSGNKFYFQSGKNQQNAFRTGINAPINYSDLKDKSNKFSLQLSLKGSDSISFVPTGKSSKAIVSSSWPDPSFGGGFLPSKKTVSDKGFKAEWDISYLARNFPQTWVNSLDESAVNDTQNTYDESASYKFRNSADGSVSSSFENAALEVSLLSPVDFYRNTLRAIKYAVLFIMLTFLTFFMFEVIAKLKIHAFQYFLIGIAVSLFYLILLSLSEFIGFNWAYILASLANIALISLYTKAIVKKVKPILSLFMAGILVFLYGFLYVLLQLQDLSLLIGSIGLFLVLALVMFFTKDIDWFEGKTTNEN